MPLCSNLYRLKGWCKVDGETIGCSLRLDKGHGRIETRRYYLCNDPDFLKLHKEWTNLHSIGMMKSKVIQGEITTEETHYYILPCKM